MNQKTEYLVDLIFKKLKDYKTKEISLERENLKKFIFSLYKENQVQINKVKNVMIKKTRYKYV